jgi:hypothetical protein
MSKYSGVIYYAPAFTPEKINAFIFRSANFATLMALVAKFSVNEVYVLYSVSFLEQKNINNDFLNYINSPEKF